MFVWLWSAMASEQYVTVVNPNDVLFGRGSGPNDHEGNIKFRDLVAQRKAEYMATNHRQTKAKIARAIVDIVLSAGGRFLKKLEGKEAENLGFTNGDDVYVVVDDDTIMEKAKQALRQNRDKTSSGSTPVAENNANLALAQAQAQLAAQQMMAPSLPISSLQTNLYTGSMQQQFEPVPVYRVNEQPAYTDNEGYATYTTTLGDPDEEELFNHRTSGGSHRGRKDNLAPPPAERVDSMQMSQLMESFRAMSTTHGNNSSSDTIGTIDNMYTGNNMSAISNMSEISISASTSLAKPSTPDNEGGSERFMMSFQQTNSTDLDDPKWAESNNSMPPPAQSSSSLPLSSSEMWSSKQINSLLQAPIDSISNITLDGPSPRNRPASMGTLGSSGMSLLLEGDESTGQILPPEEK